MIEVKNLSFQYPGNEKIILSKISLKINAFSKVGIIGSTGSGKTTLIDIILGLLDLKDNCLMIDNQPITPENKRYWQKNIGYVPQQIYLSDDTILSNIAFGVEKRNINFEKVKEVAKIANIHEFISKELPDGYHTQVGERGIRLSGGQCQRIGIARALYHDPDVIVFDEATSSLDTKTELEVMEQ